MRDHSNAGDVTGLTYEAWDDLAVKRLEEIAGEARDRWDLCAVSLAAPDRGAAGRGDERDRGRLGPPSGRRLRSRAATAIERLKEDVPIWKKEGLVTGESHWIMGS